MLRGLSNKLIAYDLGISQRTVESHRAHVMAKMRAPNFATLMRMMVVTGQGPR
jgi:FixJ family two-component response regulator